MVDVQGCCALTVRFTAHIKIRDLSTNRVDTGLHPFAADMVFEARMFPYCLFDRRPRMRNVKQTISRPREAFLEITQRKKVFIRTPVLPLIELSRELLP